MAQTVKHPPAMREIRVWSLGWEDPLEKGMTTHSSILAWRIPMDREARQASWDRKESDTTEVTKRSTATGLSCAGNSLIWELDHLVVIGQQNAIELELFFT